MPPKVELSPGPWWCSSNILCIAGCLLAATNNMIWLSSSDQTQPNSGRITSTYPDIKKFLLFPFHLTDACWRLGSTILRCQYWYYFVVSDIHRHNITPTRGQPEVSFCCSYIERAINSRNNFSPFNSDASWSIYDSDSGQFCTQAEGKDESTCLNIFHWKYNLNLVINFVRTFCPSWHCYWHWHC